ncbi:MAG: UDP-glucose/GDP-mannose dehydrogenase family protein [Candidatus Kapabacteria bacterium]|nr:UDP-glucose/GDP-mannose dehydrogenase family protein [Candidatus Kapabacteria bacterium]
MSHKVAVIGTGYVGLVTGACLADVGNDVLCIDVDPSKIERLKRGEVPIYEPGLDVVLNRTIREGRIRFSLDLVLAVKECDILMLCLPTPPGKDGQADLEMVMSAAHRVAELLNELDIHHPRIVVNKSTVPVGTAALVQGIFDSVAPARRVDVVSNPEFLREGFAVEDFMRPDRIVVGTSSPLAAEWMQSLYRPFTDRGATLLVFDEKSSEVTKYAANSFLATKISFMNDLSEYCEAVGADIENIRIGIGIDPRIGSRFLYAGIGYGGSCFPKDVKAIIHAAEQTGTPLEVIKAAKVVNDHQVRRFTGRVVARFDGDLSGKRVALWGLAFKPDTDDVREAPSFVIIDRLLSEGAEVVAFDPEARETTHRVIGDRITYADDAYSALSGADVLIIATEWQEFRDPDFARMRKELSAPIIFDGRNMFHPDDMRERGFEYHSVGRASVTQ